MPITPEQRKRRRSHIGSSDMAKILGVSEWGNALDVYVDKVGAETDDAPTAAQDDGNWIEYAIVARAREKLNLDIDPHVLLDSAPDPILESNADAATTNRQVGLEAKLVRAQRFDDLYGEPGTDQVPYDVIVQGHMYMACEPRMERVVHAVYVPREHKAADWPYYFIPRNPALIDLILKAGAEFWRNHVERRIPPTGAWHPNLDALKRLPRENRTSDVTVGDVVTWAAYREMRLAFEKAEKAAAARLVASLADADIGIVPGITERVGCHYALIESSDIDRDAMRADGVLEKYRKDKSYRRLNPILPKKTTALQLLEMFEVADGARLIELALTNKKELGGE